MDAPELLDDIAALLQRRVYGKYRGEVVDDQDPTRRGRVQVVVPAVLGDEAVWALPCVPFAGDGVGFYAIPAVGTGVWVEFEAGNLAYPIWVGCFWADDQIAAEDARPSVKFLRTSRVAIRIDDDEGSIEIAVDGGASLKLGVTDLLQKATNVIAESGTKRTALTPLHFDVHNGAHTVV